MTSVAPTADRIGELRSIETLSILSDEQLAWFLERCEERSFEPGEVIAHAGDPADHLVVMLEGTFEARTENGGAMFVMQAGHIGGLLPFSRLINYPIPSYAATAVRMLGFHKRHFPELYQELPELVPRLVAILTDRVRETTKQTTQFEKLAALGKLSAGLAHELNNPAAAARQATCSARQLFECYRDTMDQFAALGASALIFDQVRELETRAAQAVHNPTPLDSLARSDREETIAAWLESIGVEHCWQLAPHFVEANFDLDTLKSAFNAWEPNVRELALYRVSAAIEMEQILAQMSNATTRMSDLVVAMKDYSYMDRTAINEFDLNQNLETTLKLFSYRIKTGINVVKQYDQGIPKLCVNGGQLNQVWTNLIDNSIDAMEGDTTPVGPGCLKIATRLVNNQAVIEITDNGPGIPQDISSKIFDPFFTTKKLGEGTGLGLELAYRIVHQHHGDLRFKSIPGATTFTVTLPLKQPK